MKHQKLETTREISLRMSKVHLKGGKTETFLAKALWKKGYRYRKNYKKIPGSPDIAITSKKMAIFVDGEFWHGYDWIRRKEKLKSNKEYWIAKIEENMVRDKRNDKLLKEMGWKVIHFWENEIKKNLMSCLAKIENSLKK